MITCYSSNKKLIHVPSVSFNLEQFLRLCLDPWHFMENTSDLFVEGLWIWVFLIYIYLYIYLATCLACGISVLRPVTKLGSQQLKCWILTARPPGNYPDILLIDSGSTSWQLIPQKWCCVLLNGPHQRACDVVFVPMTVMLTLITCVRWYLPGFSSVKLLFPLRK